MLPFGELTFGEITFGEICFGEMTFGELKLGEMASRELTLGETPGNRNIWLSLQVFFPFDTQRIRNRVFSLPVNAATSAYHLRS